MFETVTVVHLVVSKKNGTKLIEMVLLLRGEIEEMDVLNFDLR